MLTKQKREVKITSPNLDEMDSYYINDKTTLYFKKGVSQAFIDERVKIHKAKAGEVELKEYIPQEPISTRKRLLKEEFGNDY